MALLMAGQRPLADDHSWTGWQPPTHATFNIIILKHMHDADKQVRPAAAAYFSKHMHKAHPNGIVASHIFRSWMSIWH